MPRKANPPKPRPVGRPKGSRVLPVGARVWSKRLTPAEIAACERVVAEMRESK